MQTDTRKALAKVGIYLPLDTELDLYRYVLATTGIQIPRVQVCHDHSTPWDAFLFSYFCGSLQDPTIDGTNSIWWAARGFGGKTLQNALLCDTEAKTLGASSSVMGGSERQSANLVSYVREWGRDEGCSVQIGQEKETRVIFGNGAKITALPASSKAARGPHVSRFRADEIDEMDFDVLEDGLGQSMTKPSTIGLGPIPQQNTFSSTYHNHGGTMAKYLKRANDRGWPIFKWCWRETCEEAGGWLPMADVRAKRATVSAYMWDIEYELGLPNPTGRAISTEAVERAFRSDLGVYEGRENEVIVLPGEPAIPKPHLYGHGGDWAKKVDFSVFWTFRNMGSDRPYRAVAFRRMQRRPWPEMTAAFDAFLTQFGGLAYHDGTGLGNVVHDLLTRPAEGLILSGRTRDDLFSEYIGAIERGEIEFPMIRWAYEEHLEASVDDVYGRGHPPDSIVAGALAYRATRESQRGARSDTILVPKVTQGGDSWA